MVLSLAALVGLAAGDYVFNRSSGAQDAPKKAEPDEKKSDLFELLKKELEGKKDSGLAPPPPLGVDPLPPPSGLVPTATQEKPPLPPVVDAPTPAPLPLPQGTPEETKAVTPQGPAIPAPTPIAPSKTNDPVMPPPPSNFGAQLPANLTPPPSLPPVTPPKEIAPSVPPAAPQPRSTTPANDPLNGVRTPPGGVLPTIGTDSGAAPRTSVLPPALPATAPIHATPQAAKTKTSPWTLHVEIVDDMTIVTATVNKKHEFKVVCQNLEVMTGKDAFRASGKVKITGECMNGSCERLAISLTDDRLVLEGAAELQIQKTILQVSSDDSKAAAFELKGETLNLRISELQAGKFTQVSWSKSHVDFTDRTVETKPQPPASKPGSKEWSPYGKLRRVDGNWRLEDNAGRTILRIETTNGQLLESYNGRNISVFGPMVDKMTVRVTHIAVP
jgi:hypothetical protein